MDTIFLNSENSKKPESYRLLLNISDKINLNVASWNLSTYSTWKKYNYSCDTNMFNI